MLNHTRRGPEGILVLEPDAPLEAAEFEGLAHEIDPYLAKQGTWPGLMLHAKTFPGWIDLEAVLAQMRCIERHHQKIHRVAVVSDSRRLTEVPKIAVHLVHAKVKYVPEYADEDAWRWLREAVFPAHQENGSPVS